MRAFSGFADGPLPSTSLPDAFFSDVLPTIDDLGELKVTLHVLWLTQQQGASPLVSLSQLLQDATQRLALPSAEALREALRCAVNRGTLLQLSVVGEPECYYLVNSAQGRRILQQTHEDKLALTPEALAEYSSPPDRPNIFRLYEQNIGLLQPMIAQELEEAEEIYPPEWIEEAFHTAVEMNVRNWKYVRRILERWAKEGKGNNQGRKRGKTWYTDEEYKRFIQH